MALTITTVSLPEATVGVPYLADLAATGGTPPYTWGTGSPGTGYPGAYPAAYP